MDFHDAPTVREEWYSTGSKWPTAKDMRWWHTVYPDRKDIVTSMRDLIRHRSPGEQRDETWLGAVNGPPGPESTLAFREGDKVTLNMQEMGDSQPGHYAYFQGDNGTKSTVRLYQDGELLKEQGWFTVATLPVSPDPATYRITMDTEHPAWFPLSTKAGTAWTFPSARPARWRRPPTTVPRGSARRSRARATAATRCPWATRIRATCPCASRRRTPAAARSSRP
ncbi:hypothetical protein ACFRJ7_30505 [Streptomyces sp. NPDC056747]|uniref:hypothetical protein n=1 Tax=Streptomyces sp. NPDC056747 TaxID=3345935 RepID=UPI0036C0B082